jgi:hypothetical protein
MACFSLYTLDNAFEISGPEIELQHGTYLFDCLSLMPKKQLCYIIHSKDLQFLECIHVPYKQNTWFVGSIHV